MMDPDYSGEAAQIGALIATLYPRMMKGERLKRAITLLIMARKALLTPEAPKVRELTIRVIGESEEEES